ncbi:MAG: phosphomannomutase/phosphoglucomutase [Pseudomonadota bacterium]
MDDLDKKIPDIIKKPAGPTSSVAARAALKSQEQAKIKAAAQQRVLFISLGVVLIINLIAGYFLYGILVQDKTRDNMQHTIDRELDLRVNSASSFLEKNQQKLDELAHHPDIVQALTEKNQEAFPVLSNSSIAKFEDAMGLSIFVAGEAEINRDAAIPIRFPELDLIRRAESRLNYLAEAALINGKWQINFVTPVAIDKEQPVLGTILLTLDAAGLNKDFSAVNANSGETILQQKFARGAAQNVMKLGTTSDNPGHEKIIPKSNWLIKFTPSDAMVQSATEPPTLWALIIGCSTVLSLVLAMLLSRFLVKNAKISQDSLAPTAADINKPNSGSSTDAAFKNTLFQKQDILDIAVIDEDENILGLHDTSKKKQTAAAAFVDDGSIPLNIFRSYDIRGIVGTDLTAALAEKIGQAVGSEALDQGERQLIVARDARIHSQELTNGLIKGILRSGCNVINIGIVPTPVMYFATYHFDDVRSGVMVTASHNPADYNGFKVVINNNALADEAVMELRKRIISKRVHQGMGEEIFREILPHYIERIFSDVALAGNVSLVIDAGNAVTGVVAPQLFEELGCVVTPLYCDLDGNFPNHDPDPTQEKNLQDLIAKVRAEKADLGVAFDGDGDRLVVVTPKGDIIWPDRLLMLFAKDILARNPGADVLFDVKCSRQLNQVISGYGGRPIMWKTGHSPMKAKMVETGALIGGEYSGHIFIKDRWYGFDDGMYAMARLLEIITLRDQKIDDIFAAFPQLCTTPEIKVAVPDKSKFELIKKIAEQGDFKNGNITLIDGVRVDYSKGWGLVRASNTSPALTLRFEAESEEALELIKQIFKRELLKADSSLVLEF